MNICYSGGAEGADTLFGKLAEEAGHFVIHYSFAGHKNRVGNVKILDDAALRVADPYLKQANKVLKRTFPTKSEHTNNLLRRNFWQIFETDCVYAVAGIDPNGNVYGGTAWAVTMAILLNRPVYVFDQEKGVWFIDSSFQNSVIHWETLEEATSAKTPRKPSGSYTGIGSRNLNAKGIQAIERLYD